MSFYACSSNEEEQEINIKGLLVFTGVSDGYSETRKIYKMVCMFFAVKNKELINLVLWL